MATTKTELYNNGTLVATKTSAPFNTFDWTPANGEVGSASLTVKRYEDGVLVATSAAVGGTVDAAGTVTFPAWEENANNGTQFKNALNSVMPQTHDLTRSSYSTGLTDNDHYSGCLAPNNILYSFPYKGTKIVKHDLTNSTSTVIANTDDTISGTTIYKHKSAALCWNGFIYVSAWSALQIMRINTANDTMDGIGSGVGELKANANAEYYGICMANNGNMYMIPQNATAGIKVTPSADGTSDVVETFAMSHNYYNAVVPATNGKLYCIPGQYQNTIGIIDPSNADAFTTITGDTLSKEYTGAIEAMNGKIYAHSPSHILVIDTSDDTMYTIANAGANGGSIVQLMDGKLYLVPNAQYQKFQFLDPATDAITDNGTAPAGHSLWDAINDSDGNIVGVTQKADTVNKYGNNSFALGEDYCLSRHRNY